MSLALFKFSTLNGSKESFLLAAQFCDLMTLQRPISCPASLTSSTEKFLKDSMAKHLEIHNLY